MDENPSAGHPLAHEQEELLRELVIRLTSYPGDPTLRNPQVLVGKLPENLPVTLPIPEKSHVLGTLMPSPQSLQVVLDVPLSEQEVFDFYETQLRAAGWQPPEPDGFSRGGFVQRPFSAYYQHPSGADLTLLASCGKHGPTDVRLRLDWSEQARARLLQRRREHGPGLYEIFPPLRPPAEAHIMSSGGGSSSLDHCDTSAVIELDQAMNPADLATHYATQLECAGWTRIGAWHGEQAAWNVWSVRDKDNEPWLAACFVLKLAGEKLRYHLFLLADWQSKSGSSDPSSGRT